MNPISLYACEPQPIVLAGLERVLERHPEILLVGTAHNLAAAMPHVSALAPQVVLVDQAAGLKSTFQFIHEIRELSPSSQVVIWVSDLPEMECFRALQMGAKGVLRKTLPVETLVDCVRAVATGEIWIEQSVSGHLAGIVGRRSSSRLTPREREIVRLVCRGMKNKEIAGKLSITPGTVKVHLMHIFEKAGVKDRFELALQGRQLLESDTSINVSPPASDDGDDAGADV